MMAVGFVHRDLGETARALETAETSIRVGAQAGFGMTTAFAMPQVALVLADLGAYERGSNRLKETQDHVSGSMLAFYIVVQAYCLVGMGEFNEARENLLPISGMLPNPLENFSYIVYGSIPYLHVALHIEPPEKALALIEAHLDEIEKCKLSALLSEAFYLHAKCLHKIGHLEEASASLKEARILAGKINQRRVLWQILAEAAEMELERGDLEAAERLRQDAKEIVTYIREHAPEELRESFVSQAEVKEILSSPDS